MTDSNLVACRINPAVRTDKAFFGCDLGDSFEELDLKVRDGLEIGLPVRGLLVKDEPLAISVNEAYGGNCFSDVLPNELGLLIVSLRMAQPVVDLVGAGEINAEIIPVQIRSADWQQPLSSDYVVINPLGMVDCIHAEKSKLKKTDDGYLIPKQRPTSLRADLDQYVYDAAVISDAPQLFRVRHHDLPMTLLVRIQLFRAWALMKPKLTNLVFVEMRVR